MVFNEIFPDPTADYSAELDKLKIDVASESEDPADFLFWLGVTTWMTKMALSTKNKSCGQKGFIDSKPRK